MCAPCMSTFSPLLQYLGELEEEGVASLEDAETTPTLPLLCVPNRVLFPEETLPMHVYNTHVSDITVCVCVCVCVCVTFCDGLLFKSEEIGHNFFFTIGNGLFLLAQRIDLGSLNLTLTRNSDLPPDLCILVVVFRFIV